MSRYDRALRVRYHELSSQRVDLEAGPRQSTRRRTALVLLTLTLLMSFSPTAHGTSEKEMSLLNLPLTEALLLFQEAGLPLLFSDRVVLPEMRVLVEPSTSSSTKEQLQSILAPYGITIVDNDGLLVLTRPSEGVSRPGTLRGQVLGLHDLGAVANASLWLNGLGERHLGADGRFNLEGLPPGVYRVTSGAPGYSTEAIDGVVISEGKPRLLEIRLRPQPFLNDEIVVQSSRVTLLEELPAAPLSLDRDTIESLPNLGGDVFRAASLLPGLASNEVSAQFVIRGGRRDEVQILLDGQELYSPFHLHDFDNALSIVPTEQLAGAELTTGGFSATYGDRMSGVLDLTTKRPERPSETLFSLSFIDLFALHSQTFAEDRGRWLLSARRGTIDLAQEVIGREDPSFWSAFGRGSYLLERGGEVAGRFLVTGDELNFRERDGDETKSFRTEYENSYLWVNHDRLIGRRTLLESAASIAGIQRDRRGLEDEEEKSFAIEDRRDMEVMSLQQAWNLQLGPRQSLVVGARIRRYESLYDYTNQLEPAFIVDSPLIDERPPLRQFEGQFEGDHVEAWVSDRLSPTDSVTLELGLRYDQFDLTQESHWSPRLSGAWAIGERSLLRASWGHFYQSQRAYELLVEDGSTSFFPAERSDHRALGFEHQFQPKASLDAVRVELYQREIHQPRTRYENALEPINTFPEIEPDRLRISPERGRTSGVEFLIRARASDRFSWWVAYSLSKAEDRLLEGQTRRWVPREQDQRHALNLNLDFRFARQWTLALAWRFHTGWPTTPVSFAVVEEPEEVDDGAVTASRQIQSLEDAKREETEELAVLGPYNSGRLSDYHRLDLRLTRVWHSTRGDLTFFVDIQNVYDRNNLAGFDIGPNDDEKLELSSEGWPGIYPSLGISWRF